MKRNKWFWGVTGTVAAAAILFGANAQIIHYAQAGENTRSLEEAQETQDILVDLVEALGTRVQVSDAKAERDLELCNANLVNDARLCAEARMRSK